MDFNSTSISKNQNLDQNFDSNCVFCKISRGEIASEILMESEDFYAIYDKYPKAPVHILVVDKFHREKEAVLSGKYAQDNYFEKIFAFINKMVLKYNLNLTGYKIVNNGSGYNHFNHEHFHILGGSKEEPHL